MNSWTGAYIDIGVSWHQAFVQDERYPLGRATTCSGIGHDRGDRFGIVAITEDGARHGLNQGTAISKADERSVQMTLKPLVQFSDPSVKIVDESCESMVIDTCFFIQIPNFIVEGRGEIRACFPCKTAEKVFQHNVHQ